jgi:phosphotriesterase-related protein
VVIGHGGGVLADTAMARRAFLRGATIQLEWEMQIMATGETGPVAMLLDRVAWAVREGFGSQVMLSLDVCLKVGRKRYGGGGLTQVIERLLPELRRRGVSEADIRTMTIENPRRLLTLVEPRP